MKNVFYFYLKPSELFGQPNITKVASMVSKHIMTSKQVWLKKKKKTKVNTLFGNWVPSDITQLTKLHGNF